jgi:hypothetical protein
LELLSTSDEFTYKVSQKTSKEIIISIDFDHTLGVGSTREPQYLDLYIWGLPDVFSKAKVAIFCEPLSKRLIIPPQLDRNFIGTNLIIAMAPPIKVTGKVATGTVIIAA